MKLIQELCEEIQEEIEGAKWYVTKAIELKETYPEVAKTLYTISLQEMEHMKMLHDSVVLIIKDYRDKEGEPPATMMAVYEYLHKKQIDKAADVKVLQGLYKE